MFCNSNACNAKRIPWSPPVKVEVRSRTSRDKGELNKSKVRVIVEDPEDEDEDVKKKGDDDGEYEEDEEYYEDDVRIIFLDYFNFLKTNFLKGILRG